MSLIDKFFEPMNGEERLWAIFWICVAQIAVVFIICITLYQINNAKYQVLEDNRIETIRKIINSK